MSSPFVYRSLQSIAGFSGGTLRNVNSLFLSLPVTFFSTVDVDFLRSGMKPKVRARAAELRGKARDFFKIKIWCIFFYT